MRRVMVISILFFATWIVACGERHEPASDGDVVRTWSGNLVASSRLTGEPVVTAELRNAAGALLANGTWNFDTDRGQVKFEPTTTADAKVVSTEAPVSLQDPKRRAEHVHRMLFASWRLDGGPEDSGDDEMGQVEQASWTRCSSTCKPKAGCLHLLYCAYLTTQYSCHCMYFCGLGASC